MTRKRGFALVALAVAAGTGPPLAARQFTGSSPRPHAIGLPATAFGQATPALTPASPQPACQTVPGKAWGRVTFTTVVSAQEVRTQSWPLWHFSDAILKPTKLERYCVRDTATGTTATVTYLPVPEGWKP